MKEDFDDIVRKKWEEKQFPVDQSHRADIVRLLDQNNRRRTGFVWWVFGAGGVSTLVALFVLLNDAGQLDKVMAPTENVSAMEINKAKAEAKESDNSESKVHVSAIEIQEAKKGEAVYGVDAKNDADELRHAEIEKAKFNGKSKTEAIKKVDLETEVNKSNNNSKVANKKKEQTITSTNVVDKPADEKIELKANLAYPSDNSVKVNSTESKETFVPASTPNEVESTSTPVVNTNSNTSLVVRNVFITEPIEALAFGNLDFSSKNEIGNVAPVIVKHHPVWLYAEAGMGLVPAPKANIKSGYTLRAGGGVGYGLSARQSLTLSGGYLMQKNGFDFQRSSTVEQSSFGVRSNFNTLTPERLHFVYARLGFHHRIKRHMISLFGGGQYLYGAQGTIVVKSDDQLTGISETPGKYGWLKLDGMNRFWWNAELNYGYQLTPRFSIQAGIRYNFTSIVAIDQDLEDEGYFWKGDLSSFSPSFTINYHLYGKR